MSKKSAPFRVPHLVGTYGNHFNRIVPLMDDAAFLFGRDAKCEIVIDHPDVSREHAEIRAIPDGEGWLIRDLDSSNGTTVNGVPIDEHVLEPNDRIKIYKNEYMFVEPEFPTPFLGKGPFRYLDETLAGRLVPIEGNAQEAVVLGIQTTTIGSGDFNDIVIADETVSTNHCKIKNDDGDYVLVDLKSTNGTWVNGEELKSEKTIWAGDEVGVGKVPYRFSFCRRPEPIPRDRSQTSPLMIILLLLGVIIIVLGAFLFALALAALLSDVPPFGPIPKTIVKPLWTSEVKGGISPVTVDLDGDGACEVALAANDKKLFCLDGKDGSLLWSYKTIVPITGLSTLPGKQSRLLLSTEASIRAFDWEGNVLWETPFGSFPGKLVGSPAAAKAQGGPIVLTATTAGSSYVLSGKDGSTLRACGPFAGSFVREPVFAQPRPLEPLSFVTVDYRGVLSNVSNKGGILWENRGPHVPGDPPVIGDLDGDSSIELLVRSRDESSLSVIESRRGRLLHTFRVESKVSCRPVLANLHKGRGLEFVAPLSTGQLAAYRYGMKRTLWITRKIGKRALSSPPAVYDINRDGAHDLLAAYHTGELFIFDGKDGTTLIKVKLEGPATGAVLLADINGDGRLDVVVQLEDGRVSTFTVNRPCPSHANPWPSQWGDSRRSGSPRHKPLKSDLKQ